MLFNQKDNLFISVWVLLVKRQSSFNDKKTGLQCFPLNVTASFSYEFLYPPNIILDVTAKWGDLNYIFFGEKLQELLLNHWKIDNLLNMRHLVNFWKFDLIRLYGKKGLSWICTDCFEEQTVSLSFRFRSVWSWSSSLCFVSTGGHEIAFCAWKNLAVFIINRAL